MQAPRLGFFFPRSRFARLSEASSKQRMQDNLCRQDKHNRIQKDSARLSRYFFLSSSSTSSSSLTEARLNEITQYYFMAIH